MKDRWAIFVAPLLAATSILLLMGDSRRAVWSGANEFVMLYAGARLVGTPDLYNPVRTIEVQLAAAGDTGPALRYTRLPYLAAILRPLGRLPYHTAYIIWELLALTAFVAFVLLWREPSLSMTLIAASLFVPAFTGLIKGQDVTFLLLWIALAARLQQQQRPFAAGLIFSLCAAKFHLFLLLPLLVLGQRRWRFGLGLITGFAGLVAISFAVAGLSWPQQYYRSLLDPVIHPGLSHMPNLHGMFAGLRHAVLLETLFAGSIIVAHWRIVRRTGFGSGLAATLAGGLLLSYHCYLADCVLLLPAILTVLATTTLPALRFLALMLMAPFLYYIYPRWPVVVPVAVLLFVYSMAFEAERKFRLRPLLPTA